MFEIMNNMTWQAFERNLCRLLTYEGYDNVRLVGQTGDHGADVTGIKAGKKWLFQAKHWKRPVGIDVAQETINAVYEYKADIPVIVSSLLLSHIKALCLQEKFRYNYGIQIL